MLNNRSKKNEEERKKMSESVLRYHDQIAGQTTTIAKINEDLVKEQKAKCVLEERLTKALSQITRLDEEIVQLKAMSNVNLLSQRFECLQRFKFDYVFKCLGIHSIARGTPQIKRQVPWSRTSAGRGSWSVEKGNTEI